MFGGQDQRRGGGRSQDQLLEKRVPVSDGGCKWQRHERAQSIHRSSFSPKYKSGASVEWLKQQGSAEETGRCRVGCLIATLPLHS